MYFLNSYEKHQAPKLVFSGCSQRLQEVLHGSVPDVKAKALMPIMKEYVLPGSRLYR